MPPPPHQSPNKPLAGSLYRCDFQANGAREWGGAVFTAGSVDVHYGNFIGNSGVCWGGNVSIAE